MPGPGNIGSTKAITTQHQQLDDSKVSKKSGRFGNRSLFSLKGKSLIQLVKTFSNPKTLLLMSRQASAIPQGEIKPQTPRRNAISASGKQAAVQQLKHDSKAKGQQLNKQLDQPAKANQKSATKSPRRPAPPPPITAQKKPQQAPPSRATQSTVIAKAAQPPKKSAQKTNQSPRAKQPKQTQANTPKRIQRAVDPRPDALRKMASENKNSEAKLIEQLNNLPDVPTGKPKKSSKNSNTLMTASTKALLLPSSHKGLSDHIRGISTTKDLVETWNALTHIAIKGGISSLELSLLKDQFPGQLLKVANDPRQAEMISDTHLNKMITGNGRRKKISIMIYEKKQSTIDLRERLKNLRKP